MSVAPRLPTSTYLYSRLPTRETIRLFDLDPGSGADEIRGTLREVELHDDDHYAAVPEYTALSYTWGPADAKLSNILIDGQPLAVRANLFAALHALRDPEELSTLWIDALCINQDNVYERNNQVALMAKIYRLAKQVEIWLGHVDEHVRVAFDWIRRSSSDSEDRPEVTNVVLDTLNALLQRDYWSRVWIVQEVQLAQHIILRCDEQRVLWNDFSQSCLSLQKSLTRKSNAIDLMDQRNRMMRDGRTMFDRTLETLIRTYQEWNCTEPRDHIFGFLSLASDCAFGTGLKADYGISRLDLFARTLEFCQPADPLSLGSALFHLLARKEEDRHWKEAAKVWDALSLTQSSLHSSDERSASVAGRVVQIIHFVVTISSSGDCVRHYAYPAYWQMLHWQGMNVVRTEPPRVRGRGASIRRLDQWNICLHIDGQGFIIVSTDQLKAVPNSCASLGLHEAASKCVRGRCSSCRTTSSDPVSNDIE